MASIMPDSEAFDRELRQFLDVVRVDVPSLRERRDDVPLLAERFMSEISREYGREPKRMSPDCLTALKAHDWPGNIRELSNLVERLLLFAPGETVTMKDLPEEMGGARRPTEDLYREFDSLAEGVEAFERYHVARVLAEEGANVTAAARRLGLNAARLKKKLEDL